MLRVHKINSSVETPVAALQVVLVSVINTSAHSALQCAFEKWAVALEGNLNEADLGFYQQSYGLGKW